MADEEGKTHKALVQLTESVAAYAGSDCARLTVDLLDVLIASYCLDLMEVKPDGLVHVHAAVKQAAALRDVLAGTSRGIPKI